MSLANIINILDPDCFVFGGGVSNEIDFLSEIETIVRKFVTGREYEGVFLKPKYGDASGVRGAARLGRKSIYYYYISINSCIFFSCSLLINQSIIVFFKLT